MQHIFYTSNPALCRLFEKLFIIQGSSPPVMLPAHPSKGRATPWRARNVWPLHIRDTRVHHPWLRRLLIHTLMGRGSSSSLQDSALSGVTKCLRLFGVPYVTWWDSMDGISMNWLNPNRPISATTISSNSNTKGCRCSKSCNTIMQHKVVGTIFFL